MSDYFNIVAGKSISAAAQLAMLLILAVKLPAEQIATLLAVYSLASVVAALGDLGLGTLGMKERSYGDSNKAILAVRVADRLSLLVAAIGISLLVIGSFAYSPLLACIPLLIWAPAERATETRLLMLIADGKVTSAALVSGGRRILSLGLMLVLLLVMPADFAFSVSLALSSFLSYILTRLSVPTSTPARDHRSIPLIREALPYTFTSISGQLRNIDVPLVTVLVGGVSAAAYGLGSRLASPIMLIYSSISGLILVRARYLPARVLRLFVSCLLLVPTLVSAGLFLVAQSAGPALSDAVIPWMTAEGTILIAAVASSYIFAGSGIILGTICVAYDLQRFLAGINIATIIVSLSFVSIISISTGSAFLAALASACCYVLQALILTYVIIRRSRKD